MGGCIIEKNMLADKEIQLNERMRKLNVRKKDIEESFVRSSGPGGQNTNKVSSCVSLKHIPTGINVKYQKQRSQGLNRYQARWLLLDKIEAWQNRQKQEIIKEKEKLKRQNRLRPQSLKEKFLEEKRHQSDKKKARQKAFWE